MGGRPEKLDPHSPQEVSPLPQDQPSFGISTTLIKTRLLRTPALSDG